jgi:predicted acylesterase/phospholipase RssA
VDEWKIRPHRPDNHWLDCLVGCAAGASVAGAILFGTDQKPRPVRRIKLSELQKQKAAKMAREGRFWGEPTG